MMELPAPRRTLQGVPTPAQAPDDSRVAEPQRRVARAALETTDVDVTAHAALVDDPAAGAVVTFVGQVRDHDHGRRVTGIEYVAHPSAEQVLRQVAEDVAARHPVEAVAVTHRAGALPIGGVAIAVAVSAAHRHEAFAAASELVEEVKHLLPVWKRQEFDDGTDEWVACP
jgi:molybdopterin synthase catalytic subunit